MKRFAINHNDLRRTASPEALWSRVVTRLKLNAPTPREKGPERAVQLQASSRLTVSVPVTVPQLGMDCDALTYGVSGNGSRLTVSVPVTVPQLGEEEKRAGRARTAVD
ncbi:hypothetical protein PCASD_07921 [Puccinia coronata f. sp. avenae]|uniref:Uncharacterized protein n=1 Tax=Puccinia coronata f. sp. avenae TaxID=200324 RepID=A0A2N5UQ33_9BASI|nr:hypothetical protein PCASD_07921 [Puccinia coronata f. sp. avenae]